MKREEESLKRRGDTRRGKEGRWKEKKHSEIIHNRKMGRGLLKQEKVILESTKDGHEETDIKEGDKVEESKEHTELTKVRTKGRI